MFANTYHLVSAWLLLHVYTVCFGSFSKLRYRVVSEWCLRIHFILCPRGCCHTCTLYVLVVRLDYVIVLFQSGVFEYMLFCIRVVVATRARFG